LHHLRSRYFLGTRFRSLNILSYSMRCRLYSKGGAGTPSRQTAPGFQRYPAKRRLFCPLERRVRAVAPALGADLGGGDGAFALVALLHLLRLVMGWSVMIDAWTVPMWVSWVGLVVAGGLSYYGARHAMRS